MFESQMSVSNGREREAYDNKKISKLKRVE